MLKPFLKYFLAGLFLLLATACNSYYSDQHIEIKEDGLIYKAGHTVPYTGRVIDTLNNRVLEYDVLNGLKNGEFRVSSIEGITSVYGFVTDNLNNGEWKYFYPDGQIESTGNFKNDQPHGKWTWYYDNGNTKEVGTYLDGKKTGKWFHYDENGMLKMMSLYNEGQLMNEIKYHLTIHS